MANQNTVVDVRDSQDLFPISVVAEATGVAPVTLRAWERRYGFLRPHRTPKGHRLYSVEHIALIRRVLALLDSGIPVSRVGDVLDAGRPQSAAEPGEGGTWEQLRQAMVEAVEAFDEVRLDNLYNEALANYPIGRVTEELIIPLLRDMGERWERGHSVVAEEHFFSLYIRNKLGSRWHHGEAPVGGLRVVGACLPGEQHEYGLLFFALVARARGLDPVLLGGDMPLSELPKVVSRTRARGIVLSSTVTPGWQVVERDVRQLVAAVSVPVLVGGRGAVDSGDALAAAGAISVGSELVAGVEAVYRHISEER
jgi:DNA-binding transcriptional MerR regulator